MYILIDREKMTFLHKHEDVNVCANLAWIECHIQPYSIFELENDTAFHEFTNKQLMKLYQNIAGGKCASNMGRRELQKGLIAIIATLPCADVWKFELELQASFIQEGEQASWLYKKGANKPSKQ